MTKTSKRLTIFALAFVLILALAACGGGGGGADDVLEGTYLSEDEPEMVLQFTAAGFTMSTPLAQMDMPELEGDFVVNGTFTIDQSARTIEMHVDVDALENDIRDLVDNILAQDEDLQELLADPETADFAEAMIGGVVDAMIGVMMDEILEEAEGLVLGFENDFSRLYDEETVWVRQ
ncbi:MAG: hypothetical protein FWE32_05700 [Oscillospiraceae bacterium]|nr:hypothetical protein [Oscillospiraceae bacterium]